MLDFDQIAEVQSISTINLCNSLVNRLHCLYRLALVDIEKLKAASLSLVDVTAACFRRVSTILLLNVDFLGDKCLWSTKQCVDGSLLYIPTEFCRCAEWLMVQTCCNSQFDLTQMKRGWNLLWFGCESNFWDAWLHLCSVLFINKEPTRWDAVM